MMALIFARSVGSSLPSRPTFSLICHDTAYGTNFSISAYGSPERRLPISRMQPNQSDPTASITRMVSAAVLRKSLCCWSPTITPCCWPNAAHSLKSATIHFSVSSKLCPVGGAPPEKTRITGAPSLLATTIQSFTIRTSLLRAVSSATAKLLRTPVPLMATPLTKAVRFRL